MSDKSAKPNNTAVQNALIAGSCAGMTSTIVAHPLDTIRVRLQTTSAQQFRGAWHCLQSTVKNEGVLALYKGMSSPFLAQGLYKAIMFGGYDVAQKTLRASAKYPNQPLSYAQLFMCGGFAGGVNSFVVTPIELVRNRLMVQYKNQNVAGVQNVTSYTGPVDAVRQIVKATGVRGLWKGQLATLSRDFPGVGSWYVANEYTRAQLAKAFPDSPLLPRLVTAGASAGIAFWIVALPLDTIKTMIQTNTTNTSAVQLIADRFAKDGIRGFYRGLTVGLSRGIPAAAITFPTFEKVNTWLNSKK